MSAIYDRQMSFIYVVQPELMDYAVQHEVALFDQVTEEQEKEILRELKTQKIESKEIKKTCLVKTFVFPFEYLLSRIFLGKAAGLLIWRDQKAYLKFLTNRITIDTLKEELMLNAIAYKG